jgi:hypothetical protein
MSIVFLSRALCIFCAAAFSGMVYAMDADKPTLVTNKVIVKSSVEPNYPLSALGEKITANIKLDMKLDKACELAEITVVENDAIKYAELFAQASKNAVRKWQFECVGVEQLTSVRQSFSFRPDKNIIPLQNEEGKQLGITFIRSSPIYPSTAKWNAVEAVVVVEAVVTEACEISNPTAIAEHYVATRNGKLYHSATDEGGDKFKEAAYASMLSWKLSEACSSAAPTKTVQAFQFSFQRGGSIRYELLDDLNLETLFKISNKQSRMNLRIDTTRGTCPLRLSFTALRPSTANRISLITEAVETAVNQSELFDWLTRMELINEYKLSMLGTAIGLNIPCTKIDLTN